MASAVHIQERQEEYMFKVLFNSIQEFTLKKHLHIGLDKVNGSLIHHTDVWQHLLILQVIVYLNKLINELTVCKYAVKLLFYLI